MGALLTNALLAYIVCICLRQGKADWLREIVKFVLLSHVLNVSDVIVSAYVISP